MFDSNFNKLWNGKKPVIGMVHVKALPGTPNGNMAFNEILQCAIDDAKALAEGGVHAIMIENQFDTPFLVGDKIGSETVAFLTAITQEISRQVDVALGINVHMNGAKQALAIAAACGAKFIRCFNLANAYVSNSGYVSAAAPELMRYKRQIDAQDIMVFGDFQVKHGSHAITSDRSVVEKAHDIEVCGASAAILTGAATGSAPNKMLIEDIKKHTKIPLLVGSGIDINNCFEFWPLIDGAIIGSGFKKNADLNQPIIKELVKEFVRTVENL